MIANVVAWGIDNPRQGVAAGLTLWGYFVIGVAGLCWRWRVWESGR